MNKEKILTQHILTKYNPRAIFLHGSRASGHAREHSDWDFAILVDQECETFREIIEGENIEVLPLVMPLDQKTAPWWRWHALRQGNVKIIHDPENLGPELITKVTQHYHEPLEISHERLLSKKARYHTDIDSMIDYKDEPVAFFRKLGAFYERALRFWFEILHKKNMPQVYLSLPEIKEQDPEYFELLNTLAGNSSNEEKIETAQKTLRMLFPEE
ncbi:nucleotidyltransferase domain-containing protein [Candidatus Nomurabacteria bacterium]|nr:nucleotidyltransferase domain-containing protein [Candidatus Nomurabacteria bacterium]